MEIQFLGGENDSVKNRQNLSENLGVRGGVRVKGAGGGGETAEPEGVEGGVLGEERGVPNGEARLPTLLFYFMMISFKMSFRE